MLLLFLNNLHCLLLTIFHLFTTMNQHLPNKTHNIPPNNLGHHLLLRTWIPFSKVSLHLSLLWEQSLRLVADNLIPDYAIPVFMFVCSMSVACFRNLRHFNHLCTHLNSISSVFVRLGCLTLCMTTKFFPVTIPFTVKIVCLVVVVFW